MPGRDRLLPRWRAEDLVRCAPGRAAPGAPPALCPRADTVAQRACIRLARPHARVRAMGPPPVGPRRLGSSPAQEALLASRQTAGSPAGRPDTPAGGWGPVGTPAGSPRAASESASGPSGGGGGWRGRQRRARPGWTAAWPAPRSRAARRLPPGAEGTAGRAGRSPCALRRLPTGSLPWRGWAAWVRGSPSVAVGTVGNRAWERTLARRGARQAVPVPGRSPTRLRVAAGVAARQPVANARRRARPGASGARLCVPGRFRATRHAVGPPPGPCRGTRDAGGAAGRPPILAGRTGRRRRVGRGTAAAACGPTRVRAWPTLRPRWRGAGLRGTCGLVPGVRGVVDLDAPWPGVVPATRHLPGHAARVGIDAVGLPTGRGPRIGRCFSC